MEKAYPGSTYDIDNAFLNGKTYKSNIFVMIEAKKQPDGSQTLLTLEHFQEMIDLDDYMLNITATPKMTE